MAALLLLYLNVILLFNIILLIYLLEGRDYINHLNILDYVLHSAVVIVFPLVPINFK